MSALNTTSCAYISASAEFNSTRSLFEWDYQQSSDNKEHRLQMESQFRESRYNLMTEYPPQIACAKKCFNGFSNRKIFHQVVYGLPQSGKTGSMRAIVKGRLSYSNTPPKHIVIYSGISSVDWKRQTSGRFPDQLKCFHRNDWSKMVNYLKGKNDVFIIIDECQIASKQNQTTHKIFTALGYYEKNSDGLMGFFSKDIKIVEFSATPDSVLYNVDKLDFWKAHSLKVRLEPGENYFGPQQLLEQKRIYKSSNISLPLSKCKSSIQDYKKVIYEKFNLPMYHIVRLAGGLKFVSGINNLRSVFGNECKYLEYVQNSHLNINATLSTQPLVHTFIFIKEKLRCSHTIVKTYLGTFYERPTKNLSTNTQGSARIFGYGDNGVTLLFSSIVTMRKYYDLWNTKMDYESNGWATTCFKVKSDKVQMKKDKFGPTSMGFSLPPGAVEKKKSIILLKDTDDSQLVHSYTSRMKMIVIDEHKSLPTNYKYYTSPTFKQKWERAKKECGKFVNRVYTIHNALPKIHSYKDLLKRDRFIFETNQFKTYVGDTFKAFSLNGIRNAKSRGLRHNQVDSRLYICYGPNSMCLAICYKSLFDITSI